MTKRLASCRHSIARASLLLLAVAASTSSSGRFAHATETNNDKAQQQLTEEQVWTSGSISDIYDWLQCDKELSADANDNAANDSSTWTLLRTIYRQVVGDDAMPLDEFVSGFQAPVETKALPQGHGIFATQLIPAETLVWKSTFTAQFTSPQQFRDFVRRIPSSVVACHVLSNWVFPRLLRSGDAVACVDLDPASLLHMANDESINLMSSQDILKDHPLATAGCHLEMFASRDISEGEELVIPFDVSAMNYDVSAVNQGWIDLGLLKGTLEEKPDNDEDIDWLTWNKHDYYDHFKCTKTFHNPEYPNAFPIHNLSTWSLMRSIYRDIVGKEASSIPPAPRQDDEEPLSDFQVAFESKVTPDKGRGNFAMEEVPQGQIVWKSTFGAQLYTPEQYRLFLQRLSDHPALLCDVLEWSYTRFLPSGEVVACVELDPGSLFNMADWDDELNVGPTQENLLKPRRQGCYLEVYALRDIEKGEEFAMNYDFSANNQFIPPKLEVTGWQDLGLLPYEDDEDKFPAFERLPLKDLYQYLQCEETVHNVDNRDEGYPIHEDDTWEMAREVYRELAEEDEYYTFPPPPENDKEIGLTGFAVAVQIRKGTAGGYYDRRVIADEAISAGTLVWKSTYTARFPSVALFRQFLRYIPVEVACDMILSAYIRYEESEEYFAICADLDPGTYTGFAGVKGGKANMGLGRPGSEDDFLYTGCRMEFYATRNIDVGEELILGHDFSLIDLSMDDLDESEREDEDSLLLDLSEDNPDESDQEDDVSDLEDETEEATDDANFEL